MSLSADGADRFLNALVGANSVAAVNQGTVRLHTGATPIIAEELSGNGYSRATISHSDFTVSTQSGYVRIAFPALSFFTDATSQAQTAQSIAYWLGTDLIWHREMTIVPRHAAVAAAANALYMEFLLDNPNIELVDAAVRTAAQTLVGASFTNPAMFWELHTDAATPPTSATRVQTGGLDGVPEATWSMTTVSGFRRVNSGALDFGTVNAAVDEPSFLALWNGRPEATPAGVLHAYRSISPGNITDGSAISIASNALYIGIQMAGSNV